MNRETQSRRLLSTNGTILIAFALSSPHLLVAQAKPESPKTSVSVPFVGCNSDGQLGPQDAPKGKSVLVSLTTRDASRLAYYGSERGIGVLGPRGWNCFGTYGSNGVNLFISPQPIDPHALFSQGWKGFAGPVIQISYSYGGTSGRFGVAEIIARVFPDRIAFVRKVLDEGILSASDFPTGPYPNDKLIYKSKDIVEYETPPSEIGLGTHSRLQADATPVRGAVMLIGEELDLMHLSVRLPPDLADLSQIIIQRAESDALKFSP